MRTTNLLLISFLLVVAGCAAPKADGRLLPRRPGRIAVTIQRLTMPHFAARCMEPDWKPPQWNPCLLLDLDQDGDFDFADYARATNAL